MSIIERYVHAVTKLLPLSQRADVARELRASIEDMAVDRAKHGSPTEADVKEVLEELGDPTILAGKYSNTKRYLIGPEWFDTYWTVLKQILYIVPAIVTLVVLAVNLVQAEMVWPQMFINAIGAGVGTAIQIAFWTTATFVFLERAGDVNPKDIMAASNQVKAAWTPAQLPPLPKLRQIPVADAWVSVGLTILAASFIAFTPIWHIGDSKPILDPALWDFWLPAFLVLATLSVVHKIFQAKIGNWTTPLVVTNILLGLAGIAYVIGLVTSNSTIINPEFLQSLPIKEGVDPAQTEAWARWSVGISAAAFVATYIWEMIDSIIKNRRLAKK